MKIIMKSAVEGAQTSLFCSLAPEIETSEYNGKYFSDITMVNPLPKFGYHNLEATEMAKRLWKISEEITGSKMTNDV